jgi:hypothetical protein
LLCLCYALRRFYLHFFAFAMRFLVFALQRVSALRLCDAFPPTPRPALPLRFDTRSCIAFALLIEASLIQAIYAYLRRCAALSS